MNGHRTFTEELRYQYQHGGMHIQLIALNTLVFILISLGLGIGKLTKTEDQTADVLNAIFTLNTSANGFLAHPWGLFTSIFAHFSFLHFLSNMFFLYFAGSMFQSFFTGRRLLHLYLVGGIAGGIIELSAHLVFPGLNPLLIDPLTGQLIRHTDIIVGASGSIMAIFIAMAVYRPNLQVNFIGIIPVKLILIAAIFVLSDLIGLGNKDDSTAHFAHLGGALIGFISVQQLHSSYNIINMSETFGQRISRFFSNLFKPSSKLKVERGGRPVKTDEEYNLEKKLKQEKIDKILDKISKSGYESLSKAEKDFLFSQSKK